MMMPGASRWLALTTIGSCARPQFKPPCETLRWRSTSQRRQSGLPGRKTLRCRRICSAQPICELLINEKPPSPTPKRQSLAVSVGVNESTGAPMPTSSESTGAPYWYQIWYTCTTWYHNGTVDRRCESFLKSHLLHFFRPLGCYCISKFDMAINGGPVTVPVCQAQKQHPAFGWY